MAENTLVTAEGWSKTVYGQAKDCRPDKVLIQNHYKFAEGNKLGEQFAEVVWLTDEAGITYSDGTTGDAYTLNAAIAAESQQATASGAEMTLVTTVGLKRLSTAVKMGEKAFGSFYSRMLQNMKNTMGKRVDLTMLYGGGDYGVVNTETGSSGARALVLYAHSWIAAMWLGSKGARIDIYSSGGTKRNATTDIVVTSVDPSTYTVNVTGLEAELANVVQTDQIFYKGAYGNEQTGLRTICGLGTGESYLGISVNDYPDLWAGNTYSCASGPLEMGDISKACMQAAARGGEGDWRLYVSYPTWGALADDLNGLVVPDSWQKNQAYGVKGHSFRTHTGDVEIVPTLYMREGEALAVPRKGFKRIGSTDITFDIPVIGQSHWRILDSQNGVELRAYSDQMIWGTELKSCIQFTNIVNP